jgi:hypothetical protein
MNVIPEELADVVRRAASGTAEYPADLSGIERRWRRRRRRRLVAGAACVAALVAVSLGAVPVLSGGGGGPRTPDGGHAVATSGQPQRLMIQGYDAVREAQPALAYSSHGIARLAGAALEVRPDGTFERWSLQRHVVAHQVAGVPDGRVVVLGTVDFPDKAANTLTILAPGGGGDLDRSIDDGVPARLVGATNETAYLWRSQGLVAHDLETGAERVLATADKLGGELWSAGRGEADVSGDLLLTSGADQDPCQLGTVDLRTGATGRHRVTAGPCHETWLVRLSPDLRSAAVSYLSSPQGPLRLAVVDLATSASRLDQEIQTPGDARLGLGPMPVGLAWSSPTQVRVAVAAAPDTKRVYPLEEALHVRTFDVS